MSYDGSVASSSPVNSEHEEVTDIPIATLIQHLVDAKKALSSIGTLWRANEIVSAAQSALGESVILTARTGFLRTGISQQVRLLEKVRSGIQVVYDDGQTDFEVLRYQIQFQAITNRHRMSFRTSTMPTTA